MNIRSRVFYAKLKKVLELTAKHTRRILMPAFLIWNFMMFLMITVLMVEFVPAFSAINTVAVIDTVALLFHIVWIFFGTHLCLWLWDVALLFNKGKVIE